MITIAQGLINSMEVLRLLQNDEDLKDIDVHIECFVNCRECGLTFTVRKKEGNNRKTFCIYEHRNSDEIIINGIDNWSSFSEDLPYMGDKWTYLANFGYGEFYKVYEKLKELILNFYNN